MDRSTEKEVQYCFTEVRLFLQEYSETLSNDVKQTNFKPWFILEERYLERQEPPRHALVKAARD